MLHHYCVVLSLHPLVMPLQQGGLLHNCPIGQTPPPDFPIVLKDEIPSGLSEPEVWPDDDLYFYDLFLKSCLHLYAERLAQNRLRYPLSIFLISACYTRSPDAIKTITLRTVVDKLWDQVREMVFVFVFLAWSMFMWISLFYSALSGDGSASLFLHYLLLYLVSSSSLPS